MRFAHAGERLTDRAYRAIEEEIVTLRLRPGTILSEQLLAQRVERAVGEVQVFCVPLQECKRGIGLTGDPDPVRE